MFLLGGQPLHQSLHQIFLELRGYRYRGDWDGFEGVVEAKSFENIIIPQVNTKKSHRDGFGGGWVGLGCVVVVFSARWVVGRAGEKIFGIELLGLRVRKGELLSYAYYVILVQKQNQKGLKTREGNFQRKTYFCVFFCFWKFFVLFLCFFCFC